MGLKSIQKIGLLAAAAVVSVGTFASANNEWIVGGTSVASNELPNIVSLREDGNFEFCGGTLIAPDWVLTAAHCMEVTDFRVVVGGLKISANDGQSFDVDSTIVDPLYKGEGGGNDFALVHLKGKSSVTPFKLDPNAIPQTSTEELWTAGWGTTSEGAQDASDVLLKVNVDFIPTKTCNSAYPNQLDNTMICAGDMEHGGRDSCQGDSGGPLYRIGADKIPVQVGVVSWGEGCARPKFPGVYGSIAAGYAWITKTMAAPSTPTTPPSHGGGWNP